MADTRRRHGTDWIASDYFMPWEQRPNAPLMKQAEVVFESHPVLYLPNGKPVIIRRRVGFRVP